MTIYKRTIKVLDPHYNVLIAPAVKRFFLRSQAATGCVLIGSGNLFGEYTRLILQGCAFDAKINIGVSTVTGQQKLNTLRQQAVGRFVLTAFGISETVSILVNKNG